MKQNPVVKFGDIVIATKLSNSQGNDFLNTPLKVVQEKNSNYIRVVNLNTKKEINLYYSGPQDIFELCDREKQAEILLEQISEKEKEIVALKEEHTRLIKFKTEEDYVAHKLDKILKAKNPKAIAKILAEMKRGNYL